MSILYDILIQPLVVAYDLLYTVLYGMIEDPVLAILALSIAINLLVLPLYRKADLMQKEEVAKSKKMRPMLDHIRRHFSGDERFMMQSAYYRVERYNPLSVMKEAGPLLLQIPFFIAAYRYISNIPMLRTASIGPITNLLMPDGLFQIGGLSINVLPIVMTAINCASGYVYTKDGPIRQKVQVYGTAAVFLALLYNSASGLVIYWIMNQLFSLAKNIVYSREIKDERILPTAGAVAVVVLVTIAMISDRIGMGVGSVVAECALVFAFFRIVSTVLSSRKEELPEQVNRLAAFIRPKSEQKYYVQVLLTELCMFLLVGVFIPTGVVASSVADFTDRTTGAVQSDLLLYPMTVYAGLFLVWCTVIIFARDGKKRRGLATGLWVVLGVALVNQFLFDPHVGVLYSDLVFDGELRFGVQEAALNVLCCVIVGIVCLLVFVKRPGWVKSAAAVIATSLLALCIRNVAVIYGGQDAGYAQQTNQDADGGVIRLSRNGKNVVVMMLDRAIGGYAPFIFDEMPALKESFRGFVCYPNTVSFGPYTNFGSPGLFGGYEYTPSEINKRSDEQLKDKHNEALTVLPALFGGNGYQVTVCDPPYAGYKQTPDLSIYDGYPEVRAYNLSGKFTDKFEATMGGKTDERQKHNFVLYGLFRVVPLVFKDCIYDGGNYLAPKDSIIYPRRFLDHYCVLDALQSITSVSDASENNFLMFQNATTHEPVSLNRPDYLVDNAMVQDEYPKQARTVDGLTMSMNDLSGWQHYCVNAASYREVAEWLDYLKDQGVYDNTRIILVSDHGRNLGQFDGLIHPDGLDVEYVWPLLMVKDFDSDGELSTSMEFMTNADVPTLAVKGIVDEPINPFTGKLITNEDKSDGVTITDSENYQIGRYIGLTYDNSGTTFDTSDGNWWTVHDSIFDMNNWTKLEN